MLWLLLSISAALTHASQDVLLKRHLKSLTLNEVTTALFIFAAPFLCIAALLQPIPAIGPAFFPALLADIPIDCLAALLYLRALKESDLSLCAPLISFTPLFMLISSPLITGEFPGIAGLTGVVLIVTGSYLLNIKERSRGLLEPFKALLRQRGPRYALLTALFWSITSNFHKVGLQNSSPLFWSASVTTGIALTLTIIMILTSSGRLSIIIRQVALLLPLGVLAAWTISAPIVAMKFTLAAYAISVKRLSIIISVFFGHRFFSEENLGTRLLAAACMLLGVILIAVIG
ncbi:MAG: EamA family transporter [Candidatus Dadabacteria bacterium]|nr:MAG: EamA family transporter [Candidatus Dadabacteria bacterium]